MKRVGFLYEKICNIQNLKLALYKAKRGKTSKQAVIDFVQESESNIQQIYYELKEQQYLLGNYHYFSVYDPKERVICAAEFKERVIHHAIMNVCEKYFDNRLIDTSYACRKGKGVFQALDKAKEFSKKYTWYLKLDVKKYFDNIDHNVLILKLKRVFKDRKLLALFEYIINSYHSKENKGLPIGNLTSQFFANFYLSYADNFATQNLALKHYIRYMDDILIWSNSRDELLLKAQQLEVFMNEELYLKLKPVIINKCHHGVPMLGFIIFPSQMLLNARSKKRFKDKIKQNFWELKQYFIDEATFAKRFWSMYGFVSHSANSSEYFSSFLENLNTEEQYRRLEPC